MFNVAIIGYGYWGPKLARNIQNSNNFKIKFIVDKSTKNLNKAKKDFPLCKLLKNYKSIDYKKVNLVVISTPTITHYEIANFFLKKTNVLIEKPLALSLTGVKKLENIAKKSKNKLFVDYPFIFSGSIRYMQRIIKQKKYGKLLEIESFREQAPIRKDANVVWDLGVHDISILRFILDLNPIKISSLKYNTIKTHQKDTAYINLIYKDNLRVFIKNSWVSPLKVRIIKFKFEKGFIICDENEPIYKLKVFTRKNSKSANYKLSLPEIDLSEPLFNLIEYIGNCLKFNKNPIFKNQFNIDITKVLEKI
tara:strand:- start:99 stop:1019 length:921 start_codon:yes stop_codon:yes gene_type:complete